MAEAKVDIVLFDATCPECEYVFRMEDPEIAEVIVCGDCSLNLKVTSLDRPKCLVLLELTETRGEDWGE